MADAPEVPDITRIGEPLTARQTTIGIVCTIGVVLFIGTWAMFGSMMTRMAEYDDHERRTAELEARAARLERVVAGMVLQFEAGPLERGGAFQVRHTVRGNNGAKP